MLGWKLILCFGIVIGDSSVVCNDEAVTNWDILQQRPCRVAMKIRVFCVTTLFRWANCLMH